MSIQYYGTLELIKQNIDNIIPILWLHDALVREGCGSSCGGGNRI